VNVNSTCAHGLESADEPATIRLFEQTASVHQVNRLPFIRGFGAIFVPGVSTTIPCRSSMASDMRLTQAQKRDLLRMSGAALVSTIFFSIPMFVGRPDGARLQARGEQAQPIAVAAGSAVTTDAAASAAPEVAVVFSDAVARVTIPQLQALSAPAAPRTRSVRQNAMAVKLRPRPQAASAAGKPLARRLGRLIAGTGRYEVRPFPTVGTSGS
jgi:hypothetical protein